MSVFGDNPAWPNYRRPDYAAIEADLQLIQNELGGTRTMHAAARSYIHKWKAEDDDTYAWRSTCETFFEGLGRTLAAAIGMLFAKPPAMEWSGAEAAMKEHWSNIDGAGTAGAVFVKRFAEGCVRDGLGLLLVDHPPPPRGVVVHAGNEAELNLRPTWAMYGRASAINWRTQRINNRTTLSLLVLHEPVTAGDGAFGVRTIHRFRVLRVQSALEIASTPEQKQAVADLPIMPYMATWELLELKGEAASGPDSFDRITGGTFRDRDGNVATQLPVAIGYAGRSDGIMDARFPLLGVAWANLSHWQLSTDLRFNTVVASFAQPVVTGNIAPDSTAPSSTGLRTPPQFKIGPLRLIHLEAGGTYQWVEAAGTGLERLAKLVLDKLGDIGRLGLSFLQSDTRAAETAEAKRLDASAENATLATAAQGIEDAVNLALEMHAWYVGIPKASAPVMTISRDYESTAMAADIMEAYVAAVDKAGLPARVMLEAMKQGGRIPADEDVDELVMEMAANSAAAADAAAASE